MRKGNGVAARDAMGRQGHFGQSASCKAMLAGCAAAVVAGIWARPAGGQVTNLTLQPVQWTDRLGVVHEAKNTNFDFYDYNTFFGESGLDTFLGQSATNAAGSVTMSTNRDDFGSVIEFYTYMRAAIPGIAYVKANFGDAEPYREVFPIGGPGVATLDVVEGTNATFPGPTANNVSTNNIGTAIGFIQAYEFVGNYYNNTHAAALPFVTVVYNNTITQSAYYEVPTFNPDAPRIEIRYGSWGAWDEHGHEYGHHIATVRGFDGSAGGLHTIGGNNIGPFEQGAAALPKAKLSWSEGVATHLWMMAIRDGNLAGHYTAALPAQDTNSTYDSYQSTSAVTNETHLQFRYSMENKTSSFGGAPKGEGEEWANSMVLWDFYDTGAADANGGNENFATGVNRNDQVSFGATKLFKLMDDNNTQTLRDFWHVADAAAIADPTLAGLVAGDHKHLVLGTLGEVLEEDTVANRPITNGFIADFTPRLTFIEGNDDRSGSYAWVVFDSAFDLVASNVILNDLGSPGSFFWDVNVQLEEGEQYWWAALNTSALYGATQPSLLTNIDKWYWSGLNPITVPEPGLAGLAVALAALPMRRPRRRT